MIRTNVEEAIKFCETLAQDPEFKKQYADAHEFDMKELIDMLREYDKYAYVCEVIPSDMYYELCAQYEAECDEQEEE